MRTPAARFEDLVVWRKAHRFVLAAYRLSRTFPRSETYSLSQGFIEESRYYSIPAKYPEYGDVSGSSQLPEEVGNRLAAWSQAILNSDF